MTIHARLARIAKQELSQRYASVDDQADAMAAAVLSDWRESCTITTVEQLNALPFLTLIREIFKPSPGKGCDYGGVYERRASDWHPLAGTYKDAIDNGPPRLPALLLWHPDWSAE